jgi:hypothetical protein
MLGGCFWNANKTTLVKDCILDLSQFLGLLRILGRGFNSICKALAKVCPVWLNKKVLNYAKALIKRARI